MVSNRPAGAPDYGPFTACALCARVEANCTHVDHFFTPQKYSGLYALPIPVFTSTAQAKMVDAALRRLPKNRTPATVTTTVTAKGWRIEAKREGELFGFSAELRACGCEERVHCTKKRCGKTRGRDGHCHGDMWGGKHIEHVRAFVAEVASAYAGPVTVAPIPDVRWGVDEHGKSVTVPCAG